MVRLTIKDQHRVKLDHFCESRGTNTLINGMDFAHILRMAVRVAKDVPCELPVVPRVSVPWIVVSPTHRLRSPKERWKAHLTSQKERQTPSLSPHPPARLLSRQRE